MVNRFVVGLVDVLQNGKRADFTDNPGEQPVHVLGVVADEEELVAELEEVGLNAPAHLSEYSRERLGILLVGTRSDIETDVGRFEHVELHLGAEVSLVAYDATVVVLQPDII